MCCHDWNENRKHDHAAFKIISFMETQYNSCYVINTGIILLTVLSVLMQWDPDWTCCCSLCAAPAVRLTQLLQVWTCFTGSQRVRFAVGFLRSGGWSERLCSSALWASYCKQNSSLFPCCPQTAAPRVLWWITAPRCSYDQWRGHDVSLLVCSVARPPGHRVCAVSSAAWGRNSWSWCSANASGKLNSPALTAEERERRRAAKIPNGNRRWKKHLRYTTKRAVGHFKHLNLKTYISSHCPCVTIVTATMSKLCLSLFSDRHGPLDI